jgi:hypothetical protein
MRRPDRRTPRNRRVPPNRRVASQVVADPADKASDTSDAAETFSDFVRKALKDKPREADLIKAEALAATIAHMRAEEPLSTPRRREVVTTLRDLIAEIRSSRR